MADVANILSAVVSTVVSAVSDAPPAVPPPVAAMSRPFPAGTHTGVLEPPFQEQVVIGDKRYGVAAGVQIRNTQNLIVMPMTLQSSAPVRFQLDGSGKVWRVWLLSAAEAAAPDFKK